MRKILFAALFASVVAVAAPTEKLAMVKSADGMDIAYETRGKGDIAVVLVHGWSCDRSYFHYQLKALAEKYRVVAVDLAGHGDSSLGRKDSTIASFGQDVAAVVKKLDLKRVVLVGHSMGGDVVVAAARLLKGRVAGLVWIDDYKDLGPPSSNAEIETFVAKFRADFPGTTDAFVRSLFRPDANPSLVRQISRDMSSAPPLVGTTSLASSFKYAREMPGALAELKLPVIAINADNGPTDRVSLARHGVKARVMVGSGHFLMLENPQKFETLLESSIRELTVKPKQ
ncbi:MAG: alpha/beta hydrolase [Pseudomonadota bacterium]